MSSKPTSNRTLSEFVDEFGAAEDAGATMEHDGEPALPRPQWARGKGHLVLDKPTKVSSQLRADLDRHEAWCDDCHNRVTVNKREYGHQQTCDHYCWGGVE